MNHLRTTSPVVDHETANVIHKPVTLWTVDGCLRCAKIHAMFPDAEMRQIATLNRDSDRVDVLAQLAFQGQQAPIVRIGAEFVEPERLLAEQCAGEVCRVAV